PDQLSYLAQAPDVAKASRRDLGVILASGRDAATTVAATMIGAHLAGIRFFATGGIGGVHRGAAETFDISADLQELARTPVAVVSAGAKSILDLGLTLEYLETMGVPVIGYQTDQLPAFFTRDSGHPVPLRLDDPEAIAEALRAQWGLGLGGGALIANPIPEAHNMDASQIGRVIAAAVAAARAAGIRGKALTPFLLDHIRRETGGDSLTANIALVQNNARLAAAIAQAWSRIGPKI
ncbi:MAG: pseudouridine-5'-phosphate glycosidase, partial [Bacteroidetes bacterium]